MAMQPEIVELMDQQQRDRRQLLLYAEQLDAMSGEAQRQAETIQRLTERLATGEAEREHDAAALAELRAWREAMERSRSYRLMRRVAGLDRLPLIGPALRVLRQALPRGLS